MAGMLAAQLEAAVLAGMGPCMPSLPTTQRTREQVVVYVHPRTMESQVSLWRSTLAQPVRDRLVTLGVSSLAEVPDRLRGMRADVTVQVVDHFLLEQAEQELEQCIAKLRAEFSHMQGNTRSIR
jgi:hypothetical protein